jgi:ABC-type sugar transport system permease subunit
MMKRFWTLERKRMLEGYIFISPWLIGFVMLFASAVVSSLILSFSKLTKITGMVTEWVGTANYMKAFVWDIKFVPIFLDTIKFTLIDTPLIIIFSLLISILISRDMKARGFFREIFFIPVLLGSGFVMQQLLGQNVNQQAMEVARGILLPQEVTVYLGPVISGLIKGFLDRITLILWGSGVQTLLFLAGLQGISKSLYESARCDSATEWEMFWKITLPMISPVILLNVIYTIVKSFTDINNPMMVYTEGLIKKIQFEYAAALGWIYLLFIIILVGIVYKILRSYVYHSGIR